MHYDEKDIEIIELKIALASERLRLLDTQATLLKNDISTLIKEKENILKVFNKNSEIVDNNI